MQRKETKSELEFLKESNFSNNDPLNK